MAIWYEMQKNKEGILNFLSSNCEFHDFRIESVTFLAAKKRADIFLKYDTEEEGRILRFSGVEEIHIDSPGDYSYEDSWIEGARVYLQNSLILWINEEDFHADSLEELQEAMKWSDWVKADKLCWAVTDPTGTPIEMPENLKTYWDPNDKEEHYYSLVPYEGKWD